VPGTRRHGEAPGPLNLHREQTDSNPDPGLGSGSGVSPRSLDQSPSTPRGAVFSGADSPMSSLLALTLLWAQAGATAQEAPNIAPWLQWLLGWLFLYGELRYTTGGMLGGWVTWLKAISVISLVGWTGSWIITAIKERYLGRGRWYDFVALAGLLLVPAARLLATLESSKAITGALKIGGTPVAAILMYIAVLVLVIWVEIGLWRTIRRFGRTSDVLVLVGMHLAVLLGLAVGLAMQHYGFLRSFVPDQKTSWADGIAFGAGLCLAYMGYVILAKIVALFVRELIAVRGRRLFGLARLSVHEANRRMWAPWVVLVIFALVLAFTHWFLQPPRAAEMGRLFVSTLTLLCSLLLTAMVTILTPLSIPTDIQQQTIYTVVSKPVRRLELVWGRMIGYMALVTVLVAVFGVISLFYLWRTVGTTITNTETAAVKAQKEGRARDFNQLKEQADQLRSRMAARVPVKGSLSFLDSRGTPHAMGIDVGMEQSMREPRSHIEGATPATAIWSYGIVPDPFSPASRPRLLNRKIPVRDFLRAGTVEALLNQIIELRLQIEADERAKGQPSLPAAEVTKLDASIARNKAEVDRLNTEYESLRKQADDLEAQAQAEADPTRQQALRGRARAFHSDPITIEMTFNVYRTTKGKVGDPVLAEMQVTNPRTGQDTVAIFPIKEYYVNQRQISPELLAGSMGDLRIEVRCISPTQYLGMAESDLYLLSSSGNFGVNYMKGLFGIWLQALVLTAIGVFAGTFLSWPVALLTTIAFFFAGQLAYGFLVDFTRQAVLGGGPFESLIRLLTHDNQMSELAPTPGVVIAQSLDSLVMPIMSMLVYIVPNFQALDVSNSVADGFAVSWGAMLGNTLLALAYALPFSVVGYFILKNREVAA
jgi:ABC-type transport system involved in multi-copper enzyme maturation permease subunit